MTPRPQAGVARGCLHPRARHQHGSLGAWRSDGCRCPACTFARAAARRHHAQAVATGFWDPFSDSSPTRQHLHRLRETGIGVDQISRLSGVPGSTVRALLYGRRGQPILKVRTDTATRLLAVRAADSSRARRSIIDAGETHAQLQDLLASGLRWPDLATELGRSTTSLRRSMRRGQVTVKTARAVARLHRRLLRKHPHQRYGPANAADLRRLSAEPVDHTMAS